jgi:hypothetical protein
VRQRLGIIHLNKIRITGGNGIGRGMEKTGQQQQKQFHTSNRNKGWAAKLRCGLHMAQGLGTE